MKFQKMLLIVFFMCFSFILNAQTNVAPKTSIKDAIEMAKRQDKPIVLEFFTDWCSNCKKFEAKTLKDESVVKTLQNDFIFLKIDSEKEEIAFVKENKIKSYPQFFVLNKDGAIVSKEKGFMSVEEFLEFINLKK